MLVPIYQTKQYHILEQYLIIHHCKNRKPLTLICATWICRITENTNIYVWQYKCWQM